MDKCIVFNNPTIIPGVKLGDLRKLAAAVLIGEGENAQNAGIIADKGVYETAIATEVAEGNLSEQDAVENLIDRGVAETSVWIQENGAELIEQGCMVGATWLGTYLTPVFGPQALPVCQKIGEFVGKSISKIGTKLIDEGVRKIGAYVKKVYNKTKETVVEFAKETLSKIFG